MKILNSSKKLIREMLGISSRLAATSNQIDEAKFLTAKVLINQIKSHGIYDNVQEIEFKVFSQFGDDGIIQYLINNISIENRTFIEFGVENYTEANTRFLLTHNNWKGLVMDCSIENIDYIKTDSLYWKHDLTAVHAFIEKDNINKIIFGNGISGEIGILSIDIDGNDYWVWDSINIIDPTIVIVEYNSVFGSNHAVTIPYASAFNRTKAHYSNLFWGCSLKALCLLANKKGYVFVGSNSSGNNAYFVKKGKLGNVKPLSVELGYVNSKFRESRNVEGQLSYLSGDERLIAIEDMSVYDVEKDVLVKIKEL